MSAMHNERGFTLIEVVVAFAILAISLGALYESFGGSLRRSASARTHELAALRAESLLAEFRGSNGLLPAPRKGRDAGTGYEWKITSNPYPAALAEHSPWVAERVVVEVTWGTTRPHSVTLESIELLEQVTP